MRLRNSPLRWALMAALTCASGRGVEADAGHLLEMGGRDEDVEASSGTAADMVAALRTGQRQGQNRTILHQHHAGMDDRQAQRIGDETKHKGGLRRTAEEKKQ